MTEIYQVGRAVRSFRDVGASVNVLSNATVLREGLLFRGGSIRHLDSPEAVGSPRTILNLLAGADPRWEGVTALRLPAPGGTIDVYDAGSRAVRAWLQGILRCLSGVIYPLYLHCWSGADRTGVAVSAILSALGIEEGLIVEEYCLSDGVQDGARIAAFLESLGNPARYFRGASLEPLQTALCVPGSSRPPPHPQMPS